MNKMSILLAAVATVAIASVSQALPHDLPTLNQSSRGKVGIGEDVLIGGAIVKDSSARIIIRALGPTIARFVRNHLKNPMLDVFDERGRLLVEQRSYLENSPANLAVLREKGLTPTSPNEAAVVLTVSQGRYTAVVRGENNTQGVALVEFYLANP